MKKKVFVSLCLTVVFAFLHITGFAHVVTYNDNSFSVENTWIKSDEYGYNEEPVLCSTEKGSATWKISSVVAPCRVSFWVTLADDGVDDAEIEFGSETQQFKKSISFSEGNSGWLDIGIGEFGSGGTSIKVVTNGDNAYVSALKYEELDDRYYSLTKLSSVCGSYIALLTGKSGAYVDGVKKHVDYNPPELIGDTTFVPLRFISESLGAKVGYNYEDSTVSVSLNGKEFMFKTDSAEYSLDGVKNVLTQKVVQKNGVTLVPLRIMSESFGKKVFWDESGLIVISDIGLSNYKKNSEMIPNIVDIITKESVGYGKTEHIEKSVKKQERITVCDFYGNKQAAVSFTFDDGDYGAAVYYDQLFEKYGLCGTAMLVKKNVENNIKDWIELTKKGRIAVGNHSATHDYHYSKSETHVFKDDISGAKDYFEGIFGTKVLTFAPPWGENTEESLSEIRKKHYASRGAGSQAFASSNPSDSEWFNLPARASKNLDTSEKELNEWIDNAIKQKKWLIELWHGVTEDASENSYNMDSKRYDNHLAYASQKKNDVWYATMDDAVKYLREKQNCKVEYRDSEDGEIILTLEDQLADDTFDHPLTIKVEVEFDGEAAYSQGESTKIAEVFEENGKRYVLIDALPNGKNIYIKSLS